MSHDTHQHTEGKKAVFWPGIIMGLTFWLFAFFFLSLCDHKHHGHEMTEEHGATKTEQVEVKKDESVKTEEADAKTSEEPVKTEETHE